MKKECSFQVQPRELIAWDAVDATSGLARFEVSVDHGPYTWVGTNRSMHVTLEDGSHVVSLRAVDVAGNVVAPNAEKG